MPDVNDLHKFYEANVPEYKRRHLKEVTRFFVGEMGLGITKPIKKALANFDNLKQFVSIDWFGWDEIRVKRFTTIKNKPAKKRKQDYGKCTCGGFMVKRQNRETKEYFLGCSTFPKCRNTKPLME